MAATDLLTLDEARRAGPKTATPSQHDEDLAVIVAGISQRIDALCGPVVQRTVEGERHDGGRRRVWLLEGPAASVERVAEWHHGVETVLDPETDSDLPADGYLLDHRPPSSSFVWRRRGGADARFAPGRRNVVVDYIAGRYPSTEEVDERFRLAAASIIRRMWKRESEAWAQTPDFFSQVDDPASRDRFRGFFRAVKPVVEELLVDDLLPPATRRR